MFSFNFFASFFFFFWLLVVFVFFLYFMFSFSYSVYKFGLVNFDISFIFDEMGLSFCVMVLFVSSCVFIYVVYYTWSDHSSFFFCFIFLLFVVSMILFCFSNNFFFLLMGWDGLGVTSFLLVSFYSGDKSITFGLMTLLVNRVGDAGMIISLGFMSPLFYYSHLPGLPLIFFFVTLSCLVKSAQLPFSIWLPAAMSAPTPVSSLVHSSTLVTAGIYIIIRMFGYMSGPLSIFLLVTGLSTLLLSSISGFGESNVKKIIALSTMSHMGLMILLLGYGLPFMAFYHLLSHAFFKCSLFMFSGFFLHSGFGNLDVRFLGGNNSHVNMFLCYGVLANLALMCVPFSAGFFSKDISLELSLGKNFFFFFFFLIFSVSLSLMYSIKLLLISVNFFSCFYSVLSKPVGNTFMVGGMLPLSVGVFFFSYFYYLSGVFCHSNFIFFCFKKDFLLATFFFSLFMWLMFWLNKYFYSRVFSKVFFISGLYSYATLAVCDFIFFSYYTVEKLLLDSVGGYSLGKKIFFLDSFMVKVFAINLKVLFLIFMWLLFF